MKWDYDSDQCVFTDAASSYHLVKPWGRGGITSAKTGAANVLEWPVFLNWELA